MIKRILAHFEEKRKKERLHQLHLLQVLVDQQTALHEYSLKTLDNLIRDVLKISEQQNKVFQTWMESFKVTTIPTSTVVRDEDEVRLEKDRLRAQGYPVDSPLSEQVSWIIKDLGEEDMR